MGNNYCLTTAVALLLILFTSSARLNPKSNLLSYLSVSILFNFSLLFQTMFIFSLNGLLENNINQMLVSLSGAPEYEYQEPCG